VLPTRTNRRTPGLPVVPQLRQPARLRLDHPLQRRPLAWHDGEVVEVLLHALHGELPHEGAGPGAAALGRLVDGVKDGPVEGLAVRVVEALGRVRQPELGGEHRLVQLPLPVLDVGVDPPRHELELLVKLGVLHPAHTPVHGRSISSALLCSAFGT
jgi:hypothetical protein